MAAQSDRLNEPLLLLGEQITQEIRREMAGLREELKGDMTDMAKNMERLRKQMKKLNNKVDDMQFSMHSDFGSLGYRLNVEYKTYYSLSTSIRLTTYTVLRITLRDFSTRTLPTALTPFHKIRDQNDAEPLEFPENLSALELLTDVEVSNLLTRYGLSTQGSVEVQKREFKIFIGAVIYA